ncbi:FUSC family protein [Roseomonas soli]|uniref:FUSC family protein n=2 Tax=Neoroseomonas soli TaxID=1081025 RepID=A0A9X9X3B8_9PROT|nr:FUSC family protein [Neoroseomonas soli]
MTVWAASQPVRGMLLEKSLFRAAGTVAGVAAGVLLMVAAGDDTPILVVGLALWIGLCAGLGNVLRGFVAYGTILAGYSASMVALLDVAHPGHLAALGIDRLLTVLLGVAVGAVAGLLFTPQEAEDEVEGRVRRLSAQILHAMAGRLRGEARLDETGQRTILSEMAAIDDALDRHGAGSLRSRRSGRALRGVVAAQVSAFLWLRRAEAGAPNHTFAEAGAPNHALAGAGAPRHTRAGADAPDDALAGTLSRAAQALEDAAPPAEAIAALRAAEALSRDRPTLHEAVARLHAALAARLAPGVDAAEPAHPRNPLILHRDWIGARQAALRATGTLLLVGLAWLLTGWAAGPYVMLGTSVMISLFSTAENPAFIMRHVLVNQVFGAMAALACRWLAWPLATSELQLVLMMMPFILLAAPPVAHRRTMLGAIDFTMVMLLLLQPAWPLSGTFAASLATAAGVVLAPAIALLAFRHVFPADARRRMDMLVAMMVHELQDMAADAKAAAHRHVRQARLRHRLLRVVGWAERGGARLLPAVDGSIAAMQIGGAITLFHEQLRRPDLAPADRRAIETALRRLRRLGEKPEAAARALDFAVRRLSQSTPAEAGTVLRAAQALPPNLAFFRRGGGRSAHGEE